jgi:hypothetical protein
MKNVAACDLIQSPRDASWGERYTEPANRMRAGTNATSALTNVAFILASS